MVMRVKIIEFVEPSRPNFYCVKMIQGNGIIFCIVVLEVRKVCVGESKGVEENVFTTHFDSGSRTVPRTRTHRQIQHTALPTICVLST